MWFIHQCHMCWSQRGGPTVTPGCARLFSLGNSELGCFRILRPCGASWGQPDGLPPAHSSLSLSSLPFFTLAFTKYLLSTYSRQLPKVAPIVPPPRVHSPYKPFPVLVVTLEYSKNDVMSLMSLGSKRLISILLADSFC